MSGIIRVDYAERLSYTIFTMGKQILRIFMAQVELAIQYNGNDNLPSEF